MLELKYEITEGYILELIIDNNIQKLQITKDNYIVTKRLNKPINQTKFKGDDVSSLLKRALRDIDNLGKYNEKNVKQHYEIAFEELQFQYEDYLDKKESLDKVAEQQLYEDQLDDLTEVASEFEMLLEHHNMSFFEYIFYVGEWLIADESENVASCFTAYMSTILGLDPIWVTIFGGAGSGKTTIEEASLKLIPDENKIPGIMTYASMFDLIGLYGNDYFDRKIAVLGDLGGSKDFERNEEVINVFKEMGTDEKPPQRIKDVKVQRDGAIVNEPKIFTIEGKAALTLTSVHEMKDTQMISRSIMLQPRSNDSEYEKFLRYISVDNKPSRQRQYIINNELPLLKGYIQYIAATSMEYDVINPYQQNLINWVSGIANARRSQKQVSDMVKVVTLLNKDKREIIQPEDGKMYIISTKEDNILVENMISLYDGLSSEAINFYNWLITKIDKVDHDEVREIVDGDLMLRDAKSAFTVGSIKRKVSQTMRKFQRDNISDYCMVLRNHQLLDDVEEYKSPYNLYTITDENLEPINSRKLIFDDDVTMKYIDDVIVGDFGIPGVVPGDIIKSIENEDKQYKMVLDENKLPPWSVKK